MHAAQGFARPLLVDWAFNDNRTLFTSVEAGGQTDSYLPANFDTSQFDWDTGLGTILISFNTEGAHSFLSFFDHEIVRENNTYFNEYGEFQGAPSPGQSWEIDEPGWVFGDIYDNVKNGQLDCTNSIPIGREDDVSLAMGWNFSLLYGQTAFLSLTLSEALPSGFYLGQHDPDGSHYLSSSLTIENLSSPTPEPATALLFGLGIAYWVSGRKFFRSR